jgi:peptidoglycan/LPS O-acetylase OafA/YrhL
LDKQDSSRGWSVAVEVMFYIALPVLFYKIKNIQQACNFIMIALIIRLLTLLILQHHSLIKDDKLWGDYLFLFLPNQLPIFGLGIVMYFLIYDKQNLAISTKHVFIYASILIAGLSIQPGLFMSDIFYFGIAFLIFAYSLQAYSPRLLFNAPLRYIGQISYTLYLTHWAAIYFLSKNKLLNILETNNGPSAVLGFIINYITVLLTSIILSTILYYAIENPMQMIGKRIIKAYS